MRKSQEKKKFRILIIDDNKDIHNDFFSILQYKEDMNLSDELAADLFGVDSNKYQIPVFYEIDSAFQGQEGVRKIKKAISEKRPYSLAFVDMRMPPGWDGLETIEHAWRIDPEIQVVICTAYSDYSWRQISRRLGRANSFLVLKKPFESVEVEQLASSLTEKWELTWNIRKREEEVRKAIREMKISKKLVDEKASALELTSRYKSEFMANMSHELRTPLNSILILSKLLANNKDGALEEDHRQSAETIYYSALDLLELIDELLDLSRIELGKMDVYIENIALEEFATSISRFFQPLVSEKGLNLKVTLSDGLPHSIRTDRKRLMQILKNFLSNALKFTKNGDIEFRISRPEEIHFLETYFPETKLSPENYIAFSVIDTGTGISVEKQEIVFDEFMQVDGATNRKYGGAGLGLSISKKLAKLLQGEIGLESSLGEGSMFTLYLPEEPSVYENCDSEEYQQITEKHASHGEGIKTENAPDRKSGRIEWKFKGERILIVDDDMRNVFSLKKVLTNSGVKVFVGKDGKHGLARLKDNPDIDLVIMDIMMPEMNGYDAIKEIRKQKKYKDLPIIALTAKAMAEDRDRCFESGASDYLAKPVDFEELFAKISQWL